MRFIRTLAITACALLALAAARGAQAEERRLALVIGEAAYPAMPIATAANDAGLVAQTLQAAGFDVTGARDLEETALKEAFRDFIDKVNAAGKDVVVFVYVSGYGVQLEGENYIVPVDAKIARDSDIPLRALRVSDYLKPLSASAAKLTIVALDAARANPFKLAGQPIAGGLALYEPGGATLLAFNAAPGTIAPEATKDYGPYAHALAEMMRDGGRPLMEVFENTRLRVSEMTKGAQIPWNSQRVDTDFVFFQREAGAPLRKEDVARLSQPISALGPDDGFSAALRRDTLQGLSGLRRHLSGLALRQARAGDGGGAARGDDLAALAHHGYGGSLLVLSAPLPEGSARLGRPPSSRRTARRAGAAGRIRHGRLRLSPAAAGRTRLRRSAGRLLRGPCLGLSAAAPAADLFPAAAAAGLHRPAAAGRIRHALCAAGAALCADPRLAGPAGLCRAAAEQFHLHQHA
jgi:hypothetical protein